MTLYKKGANVQLSAHFNSRELDCPCSECNSTIIDPGLIVKLESLRTYVGQALRVNSGFRCSNYQTELRLRGYETATGVSQHELGRACDVMRADSGLSGVELEALARKAGFKAVGVGHNFIHVDLRSDKDRRWEYVKR